VGVKGQVLGDPLIDKQWEDDVILGCDGVISEVLSK